MLQIAFVNLELTGNPTSRNLLIISTHSLSLDIYMSKNCSLMLEKVTKKNN